MQVEPYRWRLSGSFLAHLFKAAAQQHHRILLPTIARFVPVDGVVFDVGAHAGQYTKLFSRVAGRGRVFAFEPASYARSILRSIVWLHHLDNVTVLPMALGSAPGIATLGLPIKRSGSFGFGLAHLGAPQPRWPRVAQEPVAVTTIDAAAQALALDRLDFIKADVEGWELQLLRGGEQTLRRFRPHLLIELGAEHLARTDDRLDETFAYLASLGYAAFELVEGALASVAAPHDGDFWFIPKKGL